ncbi:MAG: hypothetical protein RMJ98_09700 [Myxococcales bacterium]|nr:hypothetical protein [Polyangiaceae bacterium]MDW8249562.1 hypothetical protein [Myxococcales bacterium]
MRILSTGGNGVAKSSPDIKNNGNIDGGEGTQESGGTGSIILVFSALDTNGGGAGIDVSEDRAVSGNFLLGGKGKNTGTPQASVQVGVLYLGGSTFESTSSIDLIDNQIFVGSTVGGSSPSNMGPIAVNLTHTKGKIEKNSILGEQGNTDSATGIRIFRSKNLQIVNNMVYSGSLTSSSNSGLHGILFSEAQNSSSPTIPS